MERLGLYVPLLLIAILDAALAFKKVSKANAEPEDWHRRMHHENRKRRLKYKMALARMREDAGYSAS